MQFTNDNNIAQIAEAYALDAIDVAQNNFGITLDWSERSIEEVENILDRLHKSAMENPPPEDTIWMFSKIFGSYIGEIYRRNHGANWGMVTIDSESFPGLQCTHNNQLFWPWGKVNNRIINGYEDNVWHYYKDLLSDKIK